MKTKHGKCSCSTGLVICHHMTAVCAYAHHNVSVTDKTTSVDINDVLKIRDIYPPKQRNFVDVQRKATTTETDAFKKQLRHTTPGGLTLLAHCYVTRLIYITQRNPGGKSTSLGADHSEETARGPREQSWKGRQVIICHPKNKNSN